MDQAINKTLSTCPQYNVSKYLIAIYNSSTFNDSDQLSIISCQAAQLEKLYQNVQLINKYCYILTFFIGYIGAILALCSYVFIKKFHTSTFYYYRAINVFDMIYLINYLYNGFPNLYIALTRTPAFYLFVNYLTRIAGRSSRLLIIWLAFERCLACQLPKYYTRIDSKRVALFVVLCCFILAFSYNSPSLYFDIIGGFYPEVPISIWEHTFRGLEGLTMLILTPIVVMGFIQMSRRKQRMISDGLLMSVGGRASLDQINTNRWLCALQLCEGIPSILNMVIIYLSYLTNFSGLTRNKAYYLKNQPFAVNANYQKLFEIQQYVLILVALLDAYNHAGHFYTYFLCSPKFRKTLFNVIKKKMNAGSTEIEMISKG